MSKKYKCYHSSNRTIVCEMAIPCRDCTFFSPDYLESKHDAITFCKEVSEIYLPAQSDFKALVIELMEKAKECL